MSTILTKISSLENSWLIAIVITVCTFFLAKFWLKVKSYPPGPIPLPVIGNLLIFRTKDHPLTVIDVLRKKYGDMFTLWIGGEPVVLISDWNLMKEAVITKSKDFIGRPQRIFGDVHAGGHTDVVFGDFGPKWENLRKIASTAIRKYTVSEKFRDTVVEAADEMIQSMLNEQQPIDPEEYVHYAILNIIAEGAFGRRYQVHEREYRELKAASDRLLKEFSAGMPADVLPFLRPFYYHKEKSFRSLMSRLRSIVFEKYNNHADSFQSGKIRDFTDAVIAARKEAEIEDDVICHQLNDNNFVNVIIDLFLGGTHTTMSAIMWLLLILGNDQDVQKKVVAEIDEIIGSRMPTQEDKAKCHYISAVIMEGQRFKTIVPFGLDRKATCDSEIGGHPIKKGTTIAFHLHAQHMNPETWPEPMEFKPERFLEDDTLSKVRKDGYVPFSVGRRGCVGEKLALTEIFLVIVRVLQKCKITLPNGPGTADLGLTDMILFMKPRNFEICVQQRKDPVA